MIRQILEHREAGVGLRRQAVLFRASHHSMLLEAELAGRHIPFHKYGGLKFVETAHVKDLLAFLRLAENPRDEVAGAADLAADAGHRAGQGPAVDARCWPRRGGDFAVWAAWKPPAGAATLWPELVALLQDLAASDEALPAQVNRVRKFYGPILETNYDHVQPRLRDLEQLEQIAGRWRSRRRMLMEMALDPPNSTQDFAGPPVLDDDYLVLSTIHSAKGLEWDAVYVIHAADGNIPSDMATKDRRRRGRGAAVVLRRLDAGQELALRLLPVAVLPSYRPGRAIVTAWPSGRGSCPSRSRHFDRRILTAGGVRAAI